MCTIRVGLQFSEETVTIVLVSNRDFFGQDFFLTKESF